MPSRALCWAAALLICGACLNVNASREHAAANRLSQTQHAEKRHSKHDVRKYCHGLDCPKYEVLKTIESVQLRSYEPATWVYADVQNARTFEEATIVGGAAVTRYFLGYNEENEVLHPTAPLVTRVEILDDRDLDFGEDFSVASYLPQEFQSSPPEPRDTDLETVRFSKETSAWVYTFPGFAFSNVIRSELRTMLDILYDNNIEVDLTSIFVAQFDLPTTFFHRHNEIWITAKDKSRHTSTDSNILRSHP